MFKKKTPPAYGLSSYYILKKENSGKTNWSHNGGLPMELILFILRTSRAICGWVSAEVNKFLNRMVRKEKRKRGKVPSEFSLKPCLLLLNFLNF